MKKFLLLLTILAFNAGGCKPQVHHEQPVTVGERTNQQGVVTQQIIRETSYTSKDVLLTPEGPKKRIDATIKWFLEEGGKPRRELPLMRSVVDISQSAKCWPVDGTNQWFAAGTDPIGNRDKLYFVLFDESRIWRSSVFNVIPQWKSGKSEYEVESGNRIMIINTPEGLIKYDVLADSPTKVN